MSYDLNMDCNISSNNDTNKIIPHKLKDNLLGTINLRKNDDIKNNRPKDM